MFIFVAIDVPCLDNWLWIWGGGGGVHKVFLEVFVSLVGYDRCFWQKSQK